MRLVVFEISVPQREDVPVYLNYEQREINIRNIEIDELEFGFLRLLLSHWSTADLIWLVIIFHHFLNNFLKIKK